MRIAILYFQDVKSLKGGIKQWHKKEHPLIRTSEKELPVEEIKQRQGENNPLFKLIRSHGLAREFPLIISTIRAFSQSKIRINSEKQVVDAEGKLVKGYNLTDEINEKVAGTIL